MRQWTNSIDPSTIPDEIIRSERAKRNQSLKRTFTPGTGRHKILTPCSWCGKQFGVRDLRVHRVKCEKKVQK